MVNNNLIIYLHGFRSSKKSSKFNILKNMFPKEKVISLDYSPHIPKLAEAQISKVITDNYHEYDILVIGTSLGGFWARWAAKQFHVKSILINPALHPDKTLSVGEFKSYQDSNKNIEVGATYLNILYYRYLRGIKNEDSRLFCTIAAYNTGAGNVAKAFTGKRRLKSALAKINALSPQEVYDHLIEHLPYEETRKYLAKVTKRIPKYQ